MISTDIKKIAAPGRRSKNRRRKFRGDQLVDGINYKPGDPNYVAEDEDDEGEWDDGEEDGTTTAEPQKEEVEESPNARAKRLEELREVEARRIASSELEAMSLRSIEEKEKGDARQRQIELDKEQMRIREEEMERKRMARQAMEEEENRKLAETIALERTQREQQRREEEAQRQEELAQETLRMEEERRQRLQQAEADALAMAAVEDEATADKRRKAEAARKKREAFLEDVNAFSQNIEEDSQRNAAARNHDISTGNALTDKLHHLNDQYKAPTDTSTNNLFEGGDLFPGKGGPLVDTPPVPPAMKDEIHENTVRIGAGSSFDELTSSLFAANTAATIHHSEESDTKLSHPKNDSGIRRETNPFDDHDSLPSHQTRQNSGQSGNGGYGEIGNDEDLEDEGTGGDKSISNILTKEERKVLSPQQRAAWRALQADLTSRRKEFHGAVTYAFDGIFSWQMYGSTEANEEGKPYTEYLMRCQWGTTWDNMQPWIVARRYREFDALDYQLRRSFPSQGNVLVKLPEKSMFSAMDATTVDRRRRALEDYMIRIAQRLPTVLRSRNMDEFLGISERITTIRALLGPNAGLLNSSSTVPTSGTSSGNGTTHQAFPRNEQLGSPIGGNYEAVKRADEDLILSPEIAEQVRSRLSASPQGLKSLDDDLLGRLEEDIKDLGVLLRIAAPLDVTKPGRLRDLLRSCTERWPRLRATAETSTQELQAGEELDFRLIPRAMQAEEDLIRSIDDYHSLVYAGSLM